MHAGAGLELPELRAGARVERREPAVVAADEHEAAAGGERAAVALLGPAIAPNELVGGHVDGREDAGTRRRSVARNAAEIALALRRRMEVLAAALEVSDHRR